MAAKLSLWGRHKFYPSVAECLTWLEFVLVTYCCITNHPRTWWLKTTHTDDLPVSVGQESRQGSPMCPWIKASHKAEPTMLPRLPPLRAQSGEEPLPSPLGFAGRIQLLVGCWTKNLVSFPAVIWMPPGSLPHGPLQQGSLLQHSSGERGPGREDTSKAEASLL